MKIFNYLAVAMLAMASPALADTFSFGQPNLPDLNFPMAGQPGMYTQNGWFFYQMNGQGSPALRVQREVAPGYTQSNPAEAGTKKGIWSATFTGQVERDSEWGIASEVFNRTMHAVGNAEGSEQAQHVAVVGQIWVEDNGTLTPTSTSWGGNFNCTDLQTVVTGKSPCVGAEIDTVTARSGGTDRYRQNIGLQISANQWHPERGPKAPTTIAYGALIGSGDTVTLERAITLRGGGQIGIGLDMVKANLTSDKLAIALAPGQRIAFDAYDNWAPGNEYGASGFGRSLRLDADWLRYTTPNGNVFNVHDSGALDLASYVATTGLYNKTTGQWGADCTSVERVTVRNGIVVGCN